MIDVRMRFTLCTCVSHHQLELGHGKNSVERCRCREECGETGSVGEVACEGVFVLLLVDRLKPCGISVLLVVTGE